MATALKSFTTGSIGRLFADSVRDKGADYFRKGRVRKWSATNDEIHATVQGNGGTYSVTCLLPDDADALECHCTCPYVTDYGSPCKHIWASLLMAQQKGTFGRTMYGPIREVYVTDDLPGEEDGDDEFARYDLSNMSDVRRVVELFNARKNGAAALAAPKPPAVPSWKRAIESLVATPGRADAGPSGWGTTKDVVYVVNADAPTYDALSLQLCLREKKTNGEWGKPRNGSPGRAELPHLPPADRDLVATLLGTAGSAYGYSHYGDTSTHALNAFHCETLLPRMAATGKLYIRAGNAILPEPVVWDGEPWAFEIVAERAVKTKGWRVAGRLVRGNEWLPLPAMNLLHPAGVAVRNENVLMAVDFRKAFDWVALFRKQPELIIPANQFDDFLAVTYAKGTTPPLKLPPDVDVRDVVEPMKPVLKVSKPTGGYSAADALRGEPVFRYGDTTVAYTDGRNVVYDAKDKTLLRRDRGGEAKALSRLDTLGLKPPRNYDPYYGLTGKKLPEIARTLIAEGWHVEAEGKLYRPAGNFQLSVSSGIDWFELHGTVDFDGKEIALPKILEAVRNKQTMVDLGDGDVGLLPEEWLKKFALLAGAGEKQKDHVRFRVNQVGLLDALLMARGDVDTDEQFRKARDKFRSFKGIEAVAPHASFVGELRPYQAEGLGWLKFLQDVGMGGCLADDMGLGKTVQVLAMLADRAASVPEAQRKPSLAVVPKSLVFNWKSEAAKFAPALKVLDYTGIEREKDPAAFANYDLVVTTYGTLRNDAAILKDVSFDYGILDESQAIKNATSESAKACRLVNARHRLAMSGTPIENHLGELGSLFEYLNPGMLDRGLAAGLFAGAGRGTDEESRTVLAHALRPYLLRRTKDQVAKDLPQKTEKTVFCEMEPKQRKVYDDLKEYYRLSLLGKVDEIGLAKSKIMILEALLRLRQAACHPGLLDPKKVNEPCAKLDALLPQLTEVFEEGHKALVFSQFTSFLTVVKKHLTKAKIPFLFLDGKTSATKRREIVEQFQTDPDSKLFLISLKAGGVGLNLTAAEYVFLLDPWWNPAVEAQAVDRAHRIGQTKPVFAYRYLAKDTVEEKVLALQQSKKALADSILTQDNALLRTLKREDLELLLS